MEKQRVFVPVNKSEKYDSLISVIADVIENTKIVYGKEQEGYFISSDKEEKNWSELWEVLVDQLYVKEPTNPATTMYNLLKEKFIIIKR